VDEKGIFENGRLFNLSIKLRRKKLYIFFNLDKNESEIAPVKNTRIYLNL